jgi:hypothetical protein
VQKFFFSCCLLYGPCIICVYFMSNFFCIFTVFWKSICLWFCHFVSVLFLFCCCCIYLYVLYLNDLFHILLLPLQTMDPWNVCMCVCICVCMYVHAYSATLETFHPLVQLPLCNTVLCTVLTFFHEFQRVTPSDHKNQMTSYYSTLAQSESGANVFTLWLHEPH